VIANTKAHREGGENDVTASARLMKMGVPGSEGSPTKQMKFTTSLSALHVRINVQTIVGVYHNGNYLAI
jgi:hypothetical protein